MTAPKAALAAHTHRQRALWAPCSVVVAAPYYGPVPSLVTRSLDFISRHGRGFTLANIAAQGGIIVTGGAVRLTESGLGCSTWPQCEPGEFTPTWHGETAGHAFIEFGNRTLTGVVLIIAGLVAIAVWRSRPELKWWGVVPLVGVLIQAGVGGLTVRAHLNPWIVGPHMIISVALVWVSVYIALRYRNAPRRVGAPLSIARIIHAVTFVAIIVLGVLTTGAGPHSGDAEATDRLDLDPALIARIHALSVWAFVLTLAYLAWRMRKDVSDTAPDEVRKAWLVLVVVTLAQGAVGYAQYFTGLPIVLVGLHMLGIAVLTAAQSAFWYLGKATR
jgi:cytochrome c oxidase assembly protein subunit 15